MKEIAVRSSDGIPLAVQDFGGHGPDVLLVHGFGGNALDWTNFAPLLTNDCRPVAIDLRCSGASGDGRYDRDAVLDDLEAVIGALELENPYVVGMSYGAWVAVDWATRHPDCPGIVSLDGARSPMTDPSNYVGLDPEELASERAALAAVFEAQAAPVAGPLSRDQVSAMISQRLGAGFPADVADAGLRRNLVSRDDSMWLRPSPAAMAAMREHLSLDLVPMFGSLRCRVLICVATRSLPGQSEALMTAYRRGLDRDLDALAAGSSTVRVVRMDAGHGLIFEQPQHVAGLVTDFVTP